MSSVTTLDAPEAPTLIRSGLELIAAKPEAERQSFAAKVGALALRPALELMTSIQTTTDPAMLWALHREFHKRGVPPNLRGPRHTLGPQGDFLDFAADLLWLQLTLAPKGRYRLARSVLKAEPDSPVWHGLMLALWHKTHDTRSRVIALGLESDHRHDLRGLAEATMRQRFDNLHGRRFSELLDAIKQALIERPDKSPHSNPSETIRRRCFLWRIHRLSGERHATTARLWQCMTGKAITRQQVARQIEAVRPIAHALEKSWKSAAEAI